MWWNRVRETTTALPIQKGEEKEIVSRHWSLAILKPLKRHCERLLIWVEECFLFRLQSCSLEGFIFQYLSWLLALPSRSFSFSIISLGHMLNGAGEYVLFRTYTAFSAHSLLTESQRDHLKSRRTSSPIPLALQLLNRSFLTCFFPFNSMCY